ncbi:MAG: transposase zinc-binding domain-containing protein [Chromatiaceae bacterium]
MAVASQGCRPVPYTRRRPENTILYRVVQQQLETYLTLAREDDWDGCSVPAYVEREFRQYLECGILAYGFARARCAECGHDFLVAFSCYPQPETMKSP